MKKTIYICDICKKEYDDLISTYVGTQIYETCPECAIKLEQIKQKYEEQFEKVGNDFIKELEELKGEKK